MVLVYLNFYKLTLVFYKMLDKMVGFVLGQEERLFVSAEEGDYFIAGVRISPKDVGPHPELIRKKEAALRYLRRKFDYDQK